jgi:hypothetical protein
MGPDSGPEPCSTRRIRLVVVPPGPRRDARWTWPRTTTNLGRTAANAFPPRSKNRRGIPVARTAPPGPDPGLSPAQPVDLRLVVVLRPSLGRHKRRRHQPGDEIGAFRRTSARPPCEWSVRRRGVRQRWRGESRRTSLDRPPSHPLGAHASRGPTADRPWPCPGRGEHDHGNACTQNNKRAISRGSTQSPRASAAGIIPP